jgi:hypothetical protein
MQTNEHGTPPEFVALGHAVFGEPDLDPASSARNGTASSARSG